MTLDFLKENQRLMYDRVWEKIKKLCKADTFGKSYNVIMFESDEDVVGVFNISSVTIIIKAVLNNSGVFYPQICLNYCAYAV